MHVIFYILSSKEYPEYTASLCHLVPGLHRAYIPRVGVLLVLVKKRVVT